MRQQTAFAIFAALLAISANPTGEASAADAQQRPPAVVQDTQRLVQEGRAAAESGDHEGALELYREALTQREQALGPDHPAVAAVLEDIAAAHRGSADFKAALAASQRALAIREKQARPQALAIAASLANIALAQRELGEYRPALAAAERSLALREKALGAEHATVALSTRIVGLIYESLGAYRAALPQLERTLAIREKTAAADSLAVALALHDLGGLHVKMGAFDKALPALERALALREQTLGAQNLAVATTLMDIARVLRETGQYEKALLLLERALQIRQARFGENHPAVAGGLYTLALLHRDIGAYDKALPLFERALAIREKVYGAAHPAVAAALQQMAWIHREKGESQRALELVQRAIAIREKSLGPDSVELAHSLINVSIMYQRTQESDKAVAASRRAVSILERAHGPFHPEVANALNSLGVALNHSGPEALAALERGLRIVTLDERPTYALRIYGNLAALHARAGRRALAILYGKYAVNLLQSIRQRIGGLDADVQQSFLDTNERSYHRLVGWLIAEGRLAEAQQVLAMLKEEELSDFLRSGPADAKTTRASYTGEEAKWVKQMDERRATLAAVGAELEALEQKASAGNLTGEERARRTQLERDRELGQQAFDRFLAALMKEVGATASAERNREVGRRNLADVQALQDTLGTLGHGAVTLHYLVLDDRTHIILTTPQVQLARESRISSVELNRAIQGYRQALQDPSRDPLPLAKQLYDLLIAPVADDLRQAKAGTLMLSLDGALRYLPFAALHDGTGYLTQTYRLAIYTEAAKDRLRDKPQANWAFSGLGLTRKIEDFSPLPGVREELEGVLKRGILPGEVHFDQQFDEDRFRATLDKRAPVLHIASHFVFRPGPEANSFLLLGDGSRLSLAQLRNYRFRDVDLITLSACETALGGGRDENGREVEGFGALAQRQGAKGVLATLWPVADRSTGELTQSLYSIRQSSPGITKAEALQQAQLRFLRGDSGYAHPFFWAPFILMGNWL